MRIDPYTLRQVKEFWPTKWEKIIDNIVSTFERMDEEFCKMKLHERIEAKRRAIIYENEILEKIIPKEELKNGIIYIGIRCHLSRFIKEAKWSEEDQVFWYKRKSGNKIFNDYIQHFADVKDDIVAGFTPIEEKQKQNIKEEEIYDGQRIY